MTRHSKQRDAICRNLLSRFDHPDAETIYSSLKEEMPDISLATVYRNLSSLEKEGKILRIDSAGIAHYDANTSDHVHFICSRCGRITDLSAQEIELVYKISDSFEGEITTQTVIFGGICSECLSVDKESL